MPRDNPPRDTLYRDADQQIVDFVFDETVAGVFPDMIRRSVPGYEAVIPITGLIAARHLPDHGLAFDLGCSLGATTLAMLRQLEAQPCRIVGVDNAPAMVERARENVIDPRVSFRCEDLRDTNLAGANVILMNYVLQFLSPDDRLAVLTNMRRQMNPDGMLIVSEKIRFEDEFQDRLYDETHLAWKRANGYSYLEISQKRSALEKVMVVDTEGMHAQRFVAAGFGKCETWFRCLNWASFLVRP